jgi:hypothetical protein
LTAVRAAIPVSRLRIIPGAGLLAHQIDGQHKVKDANLKVLDKYAPRLRMSALSELDMSSMNTTTNFFQL